jgi:NADPH2:quinone reductase
MGTRINAWRIHTHGGPEVMSWESVQLSMPRPGEVTIRHTAIGINDIDLEQRNGAFEVDLPSGLGVEAVGIVEAVAEDVAGFARGDRVAYAGVTIGAYSEAANVAATRVVPLPAHIPDGIAGALLDGLVVSYLLGLHPIRRGDRVLVTGAARGQGALFTQWARHLGAEVFAAVGTVGQIDPARRNGARDVLMRPDQLATRLQRLTNGLGVRIAFDFDGGEPLRTHLAAIVTRNACVRCNEPVEHRTGDANGLVFSRAELAHDATDELHLHANAERLFAAVTDGALQVPVGESYPLRKAKEAHADRETHSKPGLVLLVP